MNGSVAVLGCGPAGLLAAHAAVELGMDVTIFSTKAPSKIGGAQYLHRQIPGLTGEDQDGQISVEHVGTREGYALKIYGDETAPVSWDSYVGKKLPVWNMQSCYHEAWRRYSSLIRDVRVTPDFLYHLVEGRKFEHVFSCIPRPAICVNRLHRFESQDVWIQDGSRLSGDMLIVYNGDPGSPWYRTSRIFGFQGTEYPVASDAPLGCVRIKKPLHSDCDCWSGKIHPMGRYGRWEKPILIHHAYEGVADVLGQEA